MLGQQLSNHRKTVVSRSSNALLLERRGRTEASLLFEGKEASEYDVREIYELAMTGLEQLQETFAGAASLREELFGADMLDLDRYGLNQEEVRALDAKLDKHILGLSEHFLHRGTQKVLEFLVRHFQIHLHNVDAILTAFLPFHETQVFVKLVCLPLDLKGSKWAFLVNVQQSQKRRKSQRGQEQVGREEDAGFVLTRPPLVKSIVASPIVLKTMLDALLMHPTPTVTSFDAVLLCEFIQACPKHRLEAEVVPFVLPVILKALRAKENVDLQRFAYIATTALATRIIFTRKPASLLMLVSLKYASRDAVIPAVSCAAVVSTRSGIKPNDISDKILRLIVKQKLLLAALADVADTAAATAFATNISVALCSRGNGEAVLDVLAAVKLSQEQLGLLVAEIMTKMEPSSNYEKGEMENMERLLRYVATLAPDVVDTAMKDVLNRDGSEWADALCRTFATGTSIRHMPVTVEGQRTTLFLGLMHGNAHVRLAALKYLNQRTEESVLDESFQRAVVSLIEDDDVAVAIEAIKAVNHCIPPDAHLKTIATAVQAKKLRIPALTWLQRCTLPPAQLLPILAECLPPVKHSAIKPYWTKVLTAMETIPLGKSISAAEDVANAYSLLAENGMEVIEEAEAGTKLLPSSQMRALYLIMHIVSKGQGKGMTKEWTLAMTEEAVRRAAALLERGKLAEENSAGVATAMEQMWAAVGDWLNESQVWDRLLLPLAAVSGSLNAPMWSILQMYKQVPKQDAIRLTAQALAACHAEDLELPQTRLLLLCCGMVQANGCTLVSSSQVLDSSIPYVLPALTSQHAAVRSTAMDVINFVEAHLVATSEQKPKTKAKGKRGRKKPSVQQSGLTPLVSRIRACGREILLDSSAFSRVLERADDTIQPALKLLSTATRNMISQGYTAAATALLRTLRSAPASMYAELSFPLVVECCRRELLPQLSLALEPWRSETYALREEEILFVLSALQQEPMLELVQLPVVGRQFVAWNVERLVTALVGISAQTAVEVVQKLGLSAAEVILALREKKQVMIQLLNSGLVDHNSAENGQEGEDEEVVNALLDVLADGDEVDIVVVTLLNILEKGKTALTAKSLDGVVSAMISAQELHTKTLLMRLAGECLKRVAKLSKQEAAFVKLVEEVGRMPADHRIIVMEALASQRPPTPKAMQLLVHAMVATDAPVKRRMAVLANVVLEEELEAIATNMLVMPHDESLVLVQTLLAEYPVEAQLSTLLALMGSFENAWKRDDLRSGLRLAAFVSSHLRSKAFVRPLLRLTTEEVEAAQIHGERGFLGLLTKVLGLIHEIQRASELESGSDEGSGEEGSEGEKTVVCVVVSELERIVERINGLLSVPMFVVVVSDLLQDDNVHVRRLGLVQLAKKMEQHEHAWEHAERVLFLDMLEPLRSLIVTPSAVPAEKQTALLCVEILARHLGNTHPQAFVPLLAAVVDLLCDVPDEALHSERNMAMVSSVCLCLATLINVDPSELVQHINRLFPKVLAALTLADDEQKDIAQAAASTIYVISSAAHQFLSPFLPELLRALTSNTTSLNAKTLELLGLGISPRIIAPVIAQVADEVGGEKNVNGLLQVAECVVEGLSPASVRDHVDVCGGMFVSLLGCIREDVGKDDEKDNDDDEMEQEEPHEHLTRCVVAFAMLLNEDQLQGFFDKMVTRVEDEASPWSLAASHFYSVLSALTSRLGGIFLPFIERVYGMTLKHWAAYQDATSSLPPIAAVVHMRLVEHLTEFCRQVSRLHMSTATSDSAMTQERFEEIMPLLLNEVSPKLKPSQTASKKRKRGEEPNSVSVDLIRTQSVDGLVVEFIRAQVEQANWQTFHHALLSLGRKSTDVKVKLRVLGLCRVLFEEIGEEYLSLLADTLPTLAEMMDHEDPIVRKCAIATAKKVEQLSGEDLSKLLEA